MAQTTDAHDSHTVSGSHTKPGQGGPDCGTGAHQRSSIFEVEFIWDPEDTIGVPDGAVAEAAIVEVIEAVLFNVAAVLVPVF